MAKKWKSERKSVSRKRIKQIDVYMQRYMKTHKENRKIFIVPRKFAYPNLFQI